ncbi:MAG: ABC transporter substrate-binding protein [Actinomycetota bacterium]|nr:ABC transporter substrate-binding protein [Actinomycetota bacterium]
MANRLRFLTLLTALALAAVACAGPSPETGGGGGGGGGGEMVLAIGGAEAVPGGLHSQVVDLWNREHPDGPRLRLETLPDEADQQRQQMALELGAQSPNFDILGLDVIWTGEFSTNGWLEPLEDVRGQVQDVVLPGPFESATWEGRLWAVPYNTNAGFLYYRKDLVPEAPKTWDEAVQKGMQAARQAGIAPYVGQGFQYEGMVVNYLEYFWGAGGDIFNEDQSQVLYGEGDAAMRALQFMRDSQRNGFYAPGFNTMKEAEAQNEFARGNAVFMRNWPSFYTLLVDPDESQVHDKVAIAPLPTFTGEGTVSSTGGFNLAVSAFSDSKEAAKDFVVWASTNPEAQRTLAEGNLPPVMASVYEELQDDPVMALLSEVLPDARPRPPAPEWNEISETMQREIHPAYNGQKDPQAAVDAIRKVLEDSIQGG